MGNLLSCRAPTSATLILPDGKPRPLVLPVTAAELMLEHPHHFVAEIICGRRVPLPADHKLVGKKAYALLPMATAKVPAARSQSSPSLKKDRVSGGMEGQPELLMQRQYSGKQWKPSLRTIDERCLEKKVPHWVVVKC